jgi:hypothetical protein
VPRAVNLGFWTGLDFLLVAAALRASHDETNLIPPDPVPWIAGGAGFALGAAFGATQVRGGPRQSGLLATGAMVTGGALVGLVDVIAHAAFEDPDEQARRLRRDLAIGATVGLAAGYTTMLLLPNAYAVRATPVSGGALVTCTGLW